MKMFWIKGKYFSWNIAVGKAVRTCKSRKENKSALNYSLSKQGYYRGLLYMYNYFLFS